MGSRSPFPRSGENTLAAWFAILCTAFDCRIQAGNRGKLRCSQAELTQTIKAAVDMFASISCQYPEIEGGMFHPLHSVMADVKVRTDAPHIRDTSQSQEQMNTIARSLPHSCTGPEKMVCKTYLRRAQAGQSRTVKEQQE